MHHESAQSIVNRARGRDLTEDELARVESSAQRSERALDLAESLVAMQSRITQAAADAFFARFPELETRHAGARAIVLRDFDNSLHVAVASLVDDEEHPLCDEVSALVAPVWESGLPSKAIEGFHDALIREVAAQLPPAQARPLVQRLRIQARSLTNAAAVAERETALLDELDALLAERLPDHATRTPAQRQGARRLSARLLRVATLSMLPDGGERLLQGVLAFLDGARSARLGADYIAAVAAHLRDAPPRHLKPSRSAEFQQHRNTVADLVQAVSEVREHRESILTDVFATIDGRTSSTPLTKETREVLRGALERLLVLSAEAIVPRGAHALLDYCVELHQTVRRMKPPAALVAEATQLLKDKAQSRLGAVAFAAFAPTLRRAADFLSVSADLAENLPAILLRITDRLTQTHSDVFQKFPYARLLSMRDMEAVTEFALIGTLPASQEMCAQRFLAFVEFILGSRSTGVAILNEAYAQLEAEMMQSLSATSAARLVLRVRQARPLIELCGAAAPHDASLVEDAAKAALATHGAALSRVARGDIRLRRDLAVALRNALAAAAPDAEHLFARAIAHVIESTLDRAPDVVAHADAFAALLREARAKLAKTPAAPVVPLLERADAAVRIASVLAPSLDETCSAAIARLMEKDPSLESRQPGSMTVKGADDLRALVLRSIQALIPGGQYPLADALARFSDTIRAQRFNADYLSEAYSHLLKAVRAKLDRTQSALLMPVLEGAFATMLAHADIAEREESVLKQATAAVFQKLPAALAKPATNRASAETLARLVLRHSALCLTPGGETHLVGALERHYELLQKDRPGEVFVAELLDALRAAAEAHLPPRSWKPLQPTFNAVREFLVLAAGITEHQDALIADSISAMLQKHPALATRFHHIRDHAASDQRLILRYAALSLAPGGAPEMKRAMEIYRAVHRHSSFEPAALNDAFDLLATRAQQSIKLGNVKQLNVQIKTAIKYVLTNAA